MTRLPEIAPEQLCLDGEFTVEAVTACYGQSLPWRRAGKLPAVVDLAAVTRIDSSALALLLEWQSWARARGATIEFRQPPAALRTFASLSAASELLGWTEPDAES
ncbi:MAG TPA: STAS domain-containing protein [Porticoccaceae bacterium]|nr:STAS domain-containing protein [Porticoccaceae bacterium]